MPIERSVALGPMRYSEEDIIQPIDRTPRGIRERPRAGVPNGCQPDEVAALLLARSLPLLPTELFVDDTLTLRWHDAHHITLRCASAHPLTALIPCWSEAGAHMSGHASLLNGMSRSAHLVSVEDERAERLSFMCGELVGHYATSNALGDPPGLSIYVELDPEVVPLGLAWETLSLVERYLAHPRIAPYAPALEIVRSPLSP